MRYPPLSLLLYLLWSLVEVHSQTAPYVTFRGNTLPNHSYVDFHLVPYHESGRGVQCHTDLQSCCRMEHGIHRGDWFVPNNTKLPFPRELTAIYENRGAQQVSLYRRHIFKINNLVSGIYRCVIATNATHNDTDESIGEIIYVGLYANGGKHIGIIITTRKQCKNLRLWSSQLEFDMYYIKACGRGDV